MNNKGVVGFIQSHCDYPPEVMDFLNERLFKILDGHEPYSIDWVRKAKSFHETVEEKRVRSGTSQEKMTIKKMEKILSKVVV